LWPTILWAEMRRPNILVIVGDDMGYADVGFHGCKDIPTPHLDALAQRGVRCTNGYVSGPYCSPTRAGLLTGRYQNRFGHEFNPVGNDAGLPVTEKTIADRFAAAGYVTGLVGKWHLGSQVAQQPPQRGFQEFFGFLGGAHSYVPGKGDALRRGTTAVVEKEYLTDAFAREAVAFIDQHKAKPFFLYLAFNAVHTPMQATDERLKKFASIKDNTRRTYAAMMWAMDEAIGRVLAKLSDAKLADDTLIFFINDNGGPTMQGTTINGSDNTPFRGSKRTTLEGGIRVPFVVAWPGKLARGVYDKPVIQLDIQPTALAAAGIVDKEAKFDGVDLLPFLNGTNKGAPHETLYWRFGQQMAVRHGDWKLVKYDPMIDGKNEYGPAKLYNLATDPGEQTDVTAQHPDTSKQLQTRWDTWNNELVPPLWGSGKKGN
jgi:arylsulfatase A-like enzyme